MVDYDPFKILDASAPFNPWMIQFAQFITFDSAADLPIDLQSLALSLGPSLYDRGLNTRDAYIESIKIASSRPAKDRVDAESRYQEAEEALKKKLPGIFGD